MKIMETCANPKCGCRVPAEDMIHRHDKDRIRYFCSIQCSAVYDFEELKKVRVAAGKVT